MHQHAKSVASCWALLTPASSQKGFTDAKRGPPNSWKARSATQISVPGAPTRRPDDPGADAGSLTSRFS